MTLRHLSLFSRAYVIYRECIRHKIPQLISDAHANCFTIRKARIAGILTLHPKPVAVEIFMFVSCLFQGSSQQLLICFRYYSTITSICN